MSGQIHAPAVFYPEKEGRFLLNRSLGGADSKLGRFGVEKNLLAMPGFEPPAVHPVAEGKVGLSFRSFLECAVIISRNQP
jgi:hypothetical protein